MEYAYSILMFAFAVMILLYAALVAPGNFDMIPRNYAVKVSNKKEYARKFAKVLCIVAISPSISGLVALTGLILFENNDIVIAISVVILIIAMIYCIRIGIKIMSKETEKDVD